MIAAQAGEVEPTPPHMSGWPKGAYFNAPYSAYEAAYRSGRPLLIFFTAAWCHYCEIQKQEAYLGPRAEVLWNSTIVLVVDVDTDDEYGNIKQIVDRLGITEFPAIAILDVKPEKVYLRGRVVGRHNQEQLFASLALMLPDIFPDLAPPTATGWPAGTFVNDLTGAQNKALLDKAPLTIFFAADWCNYCLRMRKEVLSDPRAAVMWTKGVFLVVDVGNDDQDGNTRKLRERLEMQEEYPAFAVLSLESDRVTVRGRIVGYLEPARFFDVLAEVEPRFAAEGAVPFPSQETWWPNAAAPSAKTTVNPDVEDYLRSKPN